MNTQVARPGHMVPSFRVRDDVGGWAGLAEDTPYEAAREAQAARWLERVQWFAGGACIGCLAMWLGLIL